MVAGATQALQDCTIHTGIEPGRSHDLVEQLHPDAARAGKGEQHAAGCEQFEGQAVDVLVGTGGALGVRHGGGEFGRVEHDGVELASFGHELAQRGVHVGVHEAGA
ncbi:hypothetical protein D9M68_815900 [compost metagenome]